jgi:hypothetical protein
VRSLADNSRSPELNSRYEQRFDRQNYRALEGARAERTLQPEENKEPVQ